MQRGPCYLSLHVFSQAFLDHSDDYLAFMLLFADHSCLLSHRKVHMTGILQPIIPGVSLAITERFNAVADERGFIFALT